MAYVNISAYKFIDLTDLAKLKYKLEARCQRLSIKGTILLAEEGINLMLAGTATAIECFSKFILEISTFADLTFKNSFSEKNPFSKLKVRIKPEIVTMGLGDMNPNKHPVAPYLSPEQLKQLLDEKRELILLDVRNRYEVEMGTFNQATDLKIDNFRQLPQAVSRLKPDLKDKRVVIFCTGGIRCEKASINLKQQGFHRIYQLEGGILNYFKSCGGDYYRGDCFVFDNRFALNPQLECKG